MPSSVVAVTSVSEVEDKRQDMLPPHLMLSQLMVVTRMFIRSELKQIIFEISYYLIFCPVQKVNDLLKYR